jgi:hypothetical protein
MKLLITDQGEQLVFHEREITQTLSISSGVLATAGRGKKTVCSESGTSDQLDKITGLHDGDVVKLVANTDEIITITPGAFLKLQASFSLSGYKTIMLLCIGSDICLELTRSANS